MEVINKDLFIEHVPTEQLKCAALLGAISPEAIDYLLTEGVLYFAKQGDKIFDYGDSADNFFMVAKGSVNFYKKHHNKSVLTRKISVGEEIGFVAMMSLCDRSGLAIANEDTQLIAISWDLYGRFHDDFPFDYGLVTFNLARDMARTIQLLGDQLVDRTIENSTNLANKRSTPSSKLCSSVQNT